MCEILLCARNDTHITDPVKERLRAFKAGHVIVVQEDGATWGRLESKQQWIAEGNAAVSWPNQGRLVIVKIPPVPAAKALALLAEATEDDAGAAVVDVNGRPLCFRKRRWRLRLGLVPQAIIDALTADGEATVTRLQIRNFITRFRDDAVYVGLD